MNEYQQGFTHACRLIKTIAEKTKQPIPTDLKKLFDFVDESEIETIRRGIGLPD